MGNTLNTGMQFMKPEIFREPAEDQQHQSSVKS